MSKFINSQFVQSMQEITEESYRRYWDERNGGNLSLRIEEKELEKFDDIRKDFDENERIDLGFDAKELSGEYYLVTGTGRFFRNIKTRSNLDLGLVRISDDGKAYNIVWGFEDGGRPTSEFPSHLMCHIQRRKKDENQKVIFHCHPTNLIALSFTQELEEKKLSKLLWKMQAESIVIFPEGIGIIPYMTPGTRKIGELTSQKMQEYKAVLWAQHGLFASGNSLDEAYGLVEVIEKAAMIYTSIRSQNLSIKQEISDKDLREIADYFKVKVHPEFLD